MLSLFPIPNSNLDSKIGICNLFNLGFGKLKKILGILQNLPILNIKNIDNLSIQFCQPRSAHVLRQCKLRQ